MTVPKYNELFTPVLSILSDGQLWPRRELRDKVIDGLGLSTADREETMVSGRNRVQSRVHWATEHLIQSRAVSRPKRGVYQISDLGRTLLAEQPDGVTIERLRQTEGLKDWTRRSRTNQKKDPDPDEVPIDPTDSDSTPEEQIESGIASLRQSVADELLERIRSEGWQYFEHAVLRVLHALGYGQGEEDLVHLGKSGDGGVDGVINQDKLGLDQIYVQAKCYQEGHTFPASDIREFVGSVTGKKATRGVFITTSGFKRDAREYAERIPQPRIILIDGSELAALMIDHEVGVTADKAYKVYKIDENFFDS